MQRIKISNYKTYLSLDLDLTVDDDRPIILIGGANGGGKTTLFEAISGALYGLKIENKEHFMELLNQGALNTAKPEISLQITFVGKVLGQQQKYILKRVYQLNPQGRPLESVSLNMNGNMYVYGTMTAPKDRVKAEQEINKIIKANLPQELSQYFLFDAMQSSELLKKNVFAQTIRDNFENVLGFKKYLQLKRAAEKLQQEWAQQRLEAEKEAQEEAANRKIESILRREREWLLRGPCARGTKIKARIDRDMALINREKPLKDLAFEFGIKGRRLGGKILEAENLEKSFGNKTVIKDFTYSFKKGERIGIFGENGAGKTTFLNLLTETIPPDSGKITKGINTHISYYMQNPVLSEKEKKAQESTVLEYIRNEKEFLEYNNGKMLSASQLLEKFGFTGKMLYSQVKTLSGGERKRLYLVKLLMKDPNFLILDEPTNDFDIYTMSVLESFLTEFPGCLLVVSHDRYFMDRTTDSLFILEKGGNIKGFTGSVSEYLELTKSRNQDDTRHKNSGKEKTTAIEKEKTSPEKKKLTFKEQKEFEELEKTIETKEAEKKRLEELMSSGESDHIKLADWGTRLTKINEELEESYKRWEYLASF